MDWHKVRNQRNLQTFAEINWFWCEEPTWVPRNSFTAYVLSDKFLVRSLDRVQVVNVKTPIRLYELVGFKTEADDAKIKYIEDWEKALQKFECGDYNGALADFKALAAQNSHDNVAAYYIELVEKFFAKGKVPIETDDFGVAYNTENPADMNPEWIGTKFEIKGTFRLLQK